MLPNDFIDSKFASQLAQGTVNQDQIDHIKELYGLDDNSFAGIVKGYGNWLGNMLKGDFGTSFKYDGMPVGKVIFDNMWVSFAISFVAMVFEFAIAIPLGVYAATHQYGKVDYLVTILVIMGISLPAFFFASMLIKFFAVDLQWFPSQGLVDTTINWDGNGIGKFFNQIWHLILPIFTVVVLGVGSTMRYMRTNMLEVLNSDYIRTARAKGLSEGTVVYKHAFKNAMIPVVTMLAGILPSLFSGAMITETVFSIPGIGMLAYQATLAGDIPFVMGYNMFISVLTVIGILCSDLMYALVDPRVKLGRS